MNTVKAISLEFRALNKISVRSETACSVERPL